MFVHMFTMRGFRGGRTGRNLTTSGKATLVTMCLFSREIFVMISFFGLDYPHISHRKGKASANGNSLVSDEFQRPGQPT